MFAISGDLLGRLNRCRDMGAEYAVVILTNEFKQSERTALAECLSTLPVVEHRFSKERRGADSSEFFLVRLSDLKIDVRPHGQLA